MGVNVCEDICEHQPFLVSHQREHKTGVPYYPFCEPLVIGNRLRTRKWIFRDGDYSTPAPFAANPVANAPEKETQQYRQCQQVGQIGDLKECYNHCDCLVTELPFRPFSAAQIRGLDFVENSAVVNILIRKKADVPDAA